jgi:hypothetical protein
VSQQSVGGWPDRFDRRGFALPDEDHKSLFMNWLGEHGASVMNVARAYTRTSEESQEILLQAWRP